MRIISVCIFPKKNLRINKKSFCGFTLIELMVSSAIFITVASLSMEALLAMQKSYVRIDGLRSVMDSVNTGFDLMTRDVRYGTVFFCGNSIEDANRSLRNPCPYTGAPSDGGSAIMFKPSGASSASVRKGYFLYNKKVYEYAINALGATSSLPITGDDVFIDSLKFFVQGSNTTAASVAAGNAENAPATGTDNQQPLITITIAGRSGASNNKTNDSFFHLQTTVVPRSVDL